MKKRTFTKMAATFTVAAAAASLMATSVFADPAIIYDLGGKFDKSFNESAYTGAEQFKSDTGVGYRDFEIANDAQREQALRNFARRGSNPIVVPGFSWAAPLEKVAAEFPDTNFAIIDMVVVAPNVRSIVFNEHEGSYLVGVLAAMKSETGKLGFVGGMDIPLISKFACGFSQGAQSVNADVEVFKNMTGTTGAAWNDPVKGGELAKSQIDRGADIIFTAAGGTGLGVLQAAADAGILGIGVDSNQNYIHPGQILTSMLKRVDVAVFNAFKDQTDGNWTSGIVAMGLSNGGVGWALDENNADLITDDMKAAVKKAADDIGSGAVMVHDFTSDGTCP